MKTIKIVALFLILGFCYAHGQTFELDLTATMVKSNGPWKKNANVHITKFVHDVVIEMGEYAKDVFYLEDDEGRKVEINSKVDDCFKFDYKNAQDFWDAGIITNVLYTLKKKGFQYDLRQDMENDALQYIYELKKRNLELNDPYLNTYIYSLVAKIAPYQLIDGRPGSINIIIQDNPSINVCCYPNGTIVLNTGLLAALHTEDELVAVLAHEIAHFVLDHSIQNINAEISRQKRAEFWSGLLTGITAVAEGVAAGYAAYNSGYYMPGGATMAMAAISTSIASEVIVRLGMNYNHEQEEEADRFAYFLLKLMGYDQNALATALTRIKGEYIKERSNAAYVSSYTHPALHKRIMRLGTPNLACDKQYEQIVSFAVSSVAMMKYSDRRFRQCLPCVNQNIENGVGTSDDYILKANCLLSTKNDEASNLEVIELINKAKSLDENNVNIHKSEIIATLRIGDRTKAISLLDNYIQILNGYDLDKINSDKTWDNIRDFVITEREWAKDMIVKLKGMQLT